MQGQRIGVTRASFSSYSYLQSDASARIGEWRLEGRPGIPGVCRHPLTGIRLDL
jgi:hypothetical protein